MPEFNSKAFGKLTYSDDGRMHFPVGLFGFEKEQWFLLIEQPGTRPLLFLQSLSTPELCFVTLPVLAVDSGYALRLSAEDSQMLGLPADRSPMIGSDVLCLAIITTGDGQPPTANLLAPIVMNLRTNVAVQAIQTETGYSHQQLLPTEDAEGVTC